ncbi:hypothetical protein BDF19DRAFT_99082 [Syncephalis fuscata]|nr:hypothetical protein BDF19DRAFT_99082 [Syncephalis fuscata]
MKFTTILLGVCLVGLSSLATVFGLPNPQTQPPTSQSAKLTEMHALTLASLMFDNIESLPKKDEFYKPTFDINDATNTVIATVKDSLEKGKYLKSCSIDKAELADTTAIYVAVKGSIEEARDSNRKPFGLIVQDFSGVVLNTDFKKCPLTEDNWNSDKN